MRLHAVVCTVATPAWYRKTSSRGFVQLLLVQQHFDKLSSGLTDKIHDS
jgi:hypothetical protein